MNSFDVRPQRPDHPERREGVILAGLGGWLPRRKVTNADISTGLDTTPEWIETRTGILERRFVSDGQASRDLAVSAGQRAIRSAGGAAVDAVVVATTSPDRPCPAIAPEVASGLGLGHVGAFDVNSACSGFLYGLASSAGLISAGIADSVLLVGTEAFTTLVNPNDRATRPIFGDGAGAVVLRRGDPDEPGALGPFDLGADGTNADLLMIPNGGSRQRSANGGLGHNSAADGDWYLRMDGRAVFTNAVLRISQSVHKVIGRTGWAVDEIDWLVGHQANSRILQTVAEELDLDAERVALNIYRTGNTLTASVPLLLCDLLASGRLLPGQKVVLTAFGAGLSWGSTVMTWPELSAEAVE